MKKLLILIAILCVAAFSLGDAHATGPLRTLGFNAGYVSPEDADGTWTVGMSFDFGIPATNFLVQPFVNYWNLSEEAGGITADFSDWSIGANVKFQIPTAAVAFSPYIGAGISAHLTNAQVDALSFDESETKFGWQALGGLKWDSSGRWGLHGEGWYNGVDTVNHFSVMGGVHFNL